MREIERKKERKGGGRERERKMLKRNDELVPSPEGSTFQWGACSLSSIMGQNEQVCVCVRERERPFFFPILCSRVHTKDLFMKKTHFKYGVWKRRVRLNYVFL